MRSSLVLSVLLAALTPLAAHAQDGGADTSSPVPSDGAASTDTDDEAEAVAEEANEEVIEMDEELVSETDDVSEAVCAERVYAFARASVVRVESGLRTGSGFLVVDSSHVITSFRLVRDGHGVRVVDPDGNVRNATVMNTAGDDDLAMLELASPLPGAPLELSDWSALHVGSPVVALAHSHLGGRRRLMGGPQTEGLFDWAAAAGVVSAIGDRAIQTDIALSDGSSGGPILDCSGRVVATVSIAFAGMEPIFLGSGVPALADLVSRVEHAEGYGGRVAFQIGLGIASAFEDPGWVYGGYLQVGLTALDAFVLGGRFHYLMRNDSPSGSAVLSENQQRFRGDAYAGWRQLVTLGPGMGFHFELGLGASVTSVQVDRRVAMIDATGAIRISSGSHQQWDVRPMAVLNIQLGWVLIGYTAEWDPSRQNVEHLFDLGFRL